MAKKTAKRAKKSKPGLSREYEESDAISSQDNVKKIIGIAIVAILIFMAFLLIRPFIISIITAAILAYLFHPVYVKANEKFHKPNLSAFLVCIGIVLILVSMIFFTTQFAIKELVDFYTYSQTHDITAPLKAIFLKVSPTGPSTYQITTLADQAIEKGTSYLFDVASETIVNLPMILLQLFVIFFVMFYFLREGYTLVEYSKNLLPFKESIRKRFMARFRTIIRGFIRGTILVGVIQGGCAGIAFYILGVSQPFILTLLSILAAIIPFIGAWIVWLPVAIGLFIRGSTITGVILLVYGTVFVSYVDNILRPIIVGKMVKMPNVIALLGMLGGLHLFGIVGLVLGPLILDSVIMIIDIYRQKQIVIR